MAAILPYVYSGVVCLIIGAVFGALWGRKHPSTVESIVADAKALDKKA